MASPPRVVDVEHLGQRRLRVTFTDGLVRELDFAGLLDGVLSSLDDGVFGKVSVDAAAGTICWPEGIDLDPDVLHGDHLPANGRAMAVIREVPPPARRLMFQPVGARPDLEMKQRGEQGACRRSRICPVAL